MNSLGSSSTSVGGLFRYLSILTVMKFFLMFNLIIPLCCFVPFPLVLSVIPRSRRKHITLHFPLSGSCREQFEVAYQPISPPVVAFKYFIILISYMVEPRTAHNIQDETTPVLNTAGKSPLLTVWQRSFQCAQSALCSLVSQGTLVVRAEPAVTSSHRYSLIDLLSRQSSPILCLYPSLLCPILPLLMFPNVNLHVDLLQAHVDSWVNENH